MTDIYCYQGNELDETTDDELLKYAFSTVGHELGFIEVDAEFASFKDFKSTWRRSGTSIRFQISDYFHGAEPIILYDFSKSLFYKIKKQKFDGPSSDRLRSWLHSDDFVNRNQNLFIERSRNITATPKGEVYDLSETYNALVAKGLIEEQKNISLNWTITRNCMRVGCCSVLMRVISISSLLDSENIPQYVHEYVLYHELLHLDNSLTSGRRHHSKAFKAHEKMYPKWKESEEWLTRLAASKNNI